jgi:hypothetical protein
MLDQHQRVGPLAALARRDPLELAIARRAVVQPPQVDQAAVSG